MFRMHPLLLIIALISSGCIAEKREGLQPQLDRGINDTLLRIASQVPEVGFFIDRNPDYHTEITVLAEENATQLSKNYPAIYGNLPNKTLYKIEYKSERGLLVIIDLENKKVLRYFRIAGVNLE